MDEGWRWCKTCEDLVDDELIEGCRHCDCPLRNPVIDTGDELHQVLGEALRAVVGGTLS